MRSQGFALDRGGTAGFQGESSENHDRMTSKDLAQAQGAGQPATIYDTLVRLAHRCTGEGDDLCAKTFAETFL